MTNDIEISIPNLIKRLIQLKSDPSNQKDFWYIQIGDHMTWDTHIVENLGDDKKYAEKFVEEVSNYFRSELQLLAKKAWEQGYNQCQEDHSDDKNSSTNSNPFE
jgi:hypothetical protein